MELIPDEKSLTNMKKKSTEIFKEYAIRWREQAARVKPLMKESKIVEAFIQAQDETYYQHLLPTLGKPFIEVLKMWEMIEDGIKTGRIVSFAILKATTQAVQKGSGSVGGKKNEEDASSIAVGQQAWARGPHHYYPRAQTQVFAQAPQNLYQNSLYPIPLPPYQVYNMQPYVQPPSYPHWRVLNMPSHQPTPYTYRSPSRPGFQFKSINEIR
ncbi:putative cell differentiation protein RCD1 -like protein [Capsicum annuum]|nr:putative cell differentiation protein RCD1 -like protein [Capsicum annuum]KAF3669906.1 putative cell differentiation protein RCD1 -like protein [Capsicum annuum]